MEFHTVCLCARPVSKMGSGSSLHGPTYRHMFIWSYWVSSHHVGCILSKIFVNLLSIQQTLVKYGEQAKIQNLWKTHLRLFNITRPWLMGKGSKTGQSHGLGWVGQSGVFLFFNTTFFFFFWGGAILWCWTRQVGLFKRAQAPKLKKNWEDVRWEFKAPFF